MVLTNHQNKLFRGRRFGESLEAILLASDSQRINAPVTRNPPSPKVQQIVVAATDFYN
jgi:hypothetical protein